MKKLATPLRVWLSLIVGLWFASGLFVLGEFALTRDMNVFDALWYPSAFFDFYGYHDRFILLHTREFFTQVGFPWMYPAPCAVIYRIFYALGAHKLEMFGCALVAVALLLWALMRALVERGLSRGRAIFFLAVSTVFSWPLYFAMQRGNIEMLLWVPVALAMACFVRRRWWAGALLLGVVGAFKLYPLLCLALWIPARRYKQMAAGVATAAAVTAASLAWMGPDLRTALHGVASGVAKFVRWYTLHPGTDVMGLDHSIFALVRWIAHPADVARLLHIYMAVAAVGMTAAFFLRVRRMPRVNQMLFVVVAIVALPPTSFDYTLLSLYAVWGWLAVLAVAGEAAGALTGAMALLALLCAPESFLSWGGVCYAGPFKAVCLLVLLWVAGKWPLEREWESA